MSLTTSSPAVNVSNATNPISNRFIDGSANIYFDVTLITILTMICIAGCFGNLVVASIILCAKQMQTATNWYVFNLAISNIAITLITIPCWIVFILLKMDWPFGALPCKFFLMPVMEHFTGVCVLTHTAVAVARYVIVKHSRTRRTISTVYCRVSIAMIWVIAFLFLSVPLMGILGYFDLVERDDTVRCRLSWSSAARGYIYRISAFILTYVIPMIVTGFSYIKIHIFVDESLKRLNGQVSAETFSSRQQQTKQMNTMLMTMYVLFAITTLPLQLFFFFFGIVQLPHTIIVQIIMNILFVIFYSQVVINPLVLLYMSENFRKQMYKSPLCCCCFGNGVGTITKVFKAIGGRCKRTITSSNVFGQSSRHTQTTSVGTPSSVRAGSSEQHLHSDGLNNPSHCNGITPLCDKNPSDKVTYKITNLMEEQPMINEEEELSIEDPNSLLKAIIEDENLSEEIARLLQDDGPYMKAYYDDGTLMCIFDKAVGVTSLVDDDGRETSI